MWPCESGTKILTEKLSEGFFGVCSCDNGAERLSMWSDAGFLKGNSPVNNCNNGSYQYTGSSSSSSIRAYPPAQVRCVPCRGRSGFCSGGFLRRWSHDGRQMQAEELGWLLRDPLTTVFLFSPPPTLLNLEVEAALHEVD